MHEHEEDKRTKGPTDEEVDKVLGFLAYDQEQRLE